MLTVSIISPSCFRFSAILLSRVPCTPTTATVCSPVVFLFWRTFWLDPLPFAGCVLSTVETILQVRFPFLSSAVGFYLSLWLLRLDTLALRVSVGREMATPRPLLLRLWLFVGGPALAVVGLVALSLGLGLTTPVF